MNDSRQVLKMSDDFAEEYDASIRSKHWHGPEVLFGLMYEYLKSGQRLLDVGIGTGQSARPFKLAGINIYGVDGSEEMLKICRQKKIATELESLDLSTVGNPFKGRQFDFIISNGVFHIIGDLQPVFKTLNQKIKPGGILGFTFDEEIPNEQDGYEESEITGIFEKKHSQSGITVYKHYKGYVMDLLLRFGFRLMKTLKFQAYLDEEKQISYYFTACIAQNNTKK